jgi:hypothetical protein
VGLQSQAPRGNQALPIGGAFVFQVKWGSRTSDLPVTWYRWYQPGHHCIGAGMRKCIGGETMLNDSRAPEYQAFHNPQAIEAIKWMFSEANRTKRAKLYRTACKLEYRFRQSRGIPREGPWITGRCGHVPVGMWMLNPELRPPSSVAQRG